MSRGVISQKKLIIHGMNYHTIALPTRPQPDTIVAIFLLKKFGEKSFPGISTAKYQIIPVLSSGKTWDDFNNEGYLLIDVGGGLFDHHGKPNQTTATLLVSEYLKIEQNPALKKLLDYTERDDKYGKGTISSDVLDRAFGLSGLITALNKKYHVETIKVIDIILPLIDAHYEEENKRFTELPAEFEKAQKEDKVFVTEVKQKKNILNVVFMESDNVGMPGFLRSSYGGKYDIVVQRRSTGHVNILTRPLKRPDIRVLAGVIRSTEAKITSDIDINPESIEAQATGRSDLAPNWYFDPATNSLQNGGVSPDSVEPTKISNELLRKIVPMGLQM